MSKYKCMLSLTLSLMTSACNCDINLIFSINSVESNTSAHLTVHRITEEPLYIITGTSDGRALTTKIEAPCDIKITFKPDEGRTQYYYHYTAMIGYSSHGLSIPTNLWMNPATNPPPPSYGLGGDTLYNIFFSKTLYNTNGDAIISTYVVQQLGK